MSIHLQSHRWFGRSRLTPRAGSLLRSHLFRLLPSSSPTHALQAIPARKRILLFYWEPFKKLKYLHAIYDHLCKWWQGQLPIPRWHYAGMVNYEIWRVCRILRFFFFKTFKYLPSEVVNFECFNSCGLDKKNEGKCMCFKRRLGTDMRRDFFYGAICSIPSGKLT